MLTMLEAEFATTGKQRREAFARMAADLRAAHEQHRVV